MPTGYEIIQEEVQEVMNKPPHWMIRAGSAVLLGVIAVMVLLLSVISIPQSVGGTMLVTANGKGILHIAESDMAGIRQGMPLELYFTAYPSDRYGYVSTTLGVLADTLNADKTISISVPLRDSMLSSERQPLLIRHGMTAEGRVVVKRVSLLSSLLNR